MLKSRFKYKKPTYDFSLKSFFGTLTRFNFSFVLPTICQCFTYGGTPAAKHYNLRDVGVTYQIKEIIYSMVNTFISYPDQRNQPVMVLLICGTRIVIKLIFGRKLGEPQSIISYKFKKKLILHRCKKCFFYKRKPSQY